MNLGCYHSEDIAEAHGYGNSTRKYVRPPRSVDGTSGCASVVVVTGMSIQEQQRQLTWKRDKALCGLGALHRPSEMDLSLCVKMMYAGRIRFQRPGCVCCEEKNLGSEEKLVLLWLDPGGSAEE
jgi:hypothetical protein